MEYPSKNVSVPFIAGVKVPLKHFKDSKAEALESVGFQGEKESKRGAFYHPGIECRKGVGETKGIGGGMAIAGKQGKGDDIRFPGAIFEALQNRPGSALISKQGSWKGEALESEAWALFDLELNLTTKQ